MEHVPAVTEPGLSTGRERHVQIEFTARIVNGEPHGVFALGADITAEVAAAEAGRAAGTVRSRRARAAGDPGDRGTDMTTQT